MSVTGIIGLLRPILSERAAAPGVGFRPTSPTVPMGPTEGTGGTRESGPTRRPGSRCQEGRFVRDRRSPGCRPGMVSGCPVCVGPAVPRCPEARPVTAGVDTLDRRILRPAAKSS